MVKPSIARPLFSVLNLRYPLVRITPVQSARVVDPSLPRPDHKHSFNPLILLNVADMSQPTPYRNLDLARHGDVFVLTLQKPPENRLNTWYCQEIIRALNDARKALGHESDGALIIRGNDNKFFCTVGSSAPRV